MAVYRFRVSFEDFDDIVREIDIKSNHTFEDLHRAIHTATGYNVEQSSSFYVSNDQWTKGDEIAYLPAPRKADRGVALMGKTKLSSLIDDPHQKFYYTYNFDRPFDFHVELIKILLTEEAGKTYPNIFRSAGEVPKLVANTFTAAQNTSANEDFDFLNDMDFVPEDTEELEGISDMGLDSGDGNHEEEEEKDEFMDEFSDDEGYDNDDYNNKDDY